MYYPGGFYSVNISITHYFLAEFPEFCYSNMKGYFIFPTRVIELKMYSSIIHHTFSSQQSRNGTLIFST